MSLGERDTGSLPRRDTGSLRRTETPKNMISGLKFRAFRTRLGGNFGQCLGNLAAKPTNTTTTKHIDSGSGRGDKNFKIFPGTEIGVAELRSRRFLDRLNGTGVNLILKSTTTVDNHERTLLFL